jgi:glycosyltransferase 2 family protein
VIIFRIFYFWIPALVSVAVVVSFERSRLAAAIGPAAHESKASAVPEPPVIVPGLNAHELERELKQKAV